MLHLDSHCMNLSVKPIKDVQKLTTFDFPWYLVLRGTRRLSLPEVIMQFLYKNKNKPASTCVFRM